MTPDLDTLERTIRDRLAEAEYESGEWHRWMLELRNVIYLRLLWEV